MSESDDTADAASASQTTDSFYDALANTERRLVLAYLATADEPVTLAALSESIAAHLEDDRPEGHVESSALRIELHHWHLPKLEHAGLIRYDAETRSVRAADHPLWSSVHELPGLDVF